MDPVVHYGDVLCSLINLANGCVSVLLSETCSVRRAVETPDEVAYIHECPGMAMSLPSYTRHGYIDFIIGQQYFLSWRSDRLAVFV